MIKDVFLSLLKGGLVGIFGLVPGASIGSLLLCFNSYNDATEGFSKILNKNNKKRVLICLPLIIGVILGLLAGFNFIKILTAKYLAQTVFFVVGLLVGGYILLLVNSKTKRSLKSILIIIVTFIVFVTIYVLYNQFNLNIPNNILNIILIGLTLGVTFILPGTSASSYLLISQKYNHIVNLFSSTSLVNILLIALLIISFIIGIIISSKIIFNIYKKHKKIFLPLFEGLLLASIAIIILQIESFTFDFVNIFTTILTFLWGYILAKNIVKE